jgi:hypothetical protein
MVSKEIFQSKCIDLLEKIPRTHAVNSFRSAFNHLKKAEILIPIDPSMAVFRVITAEEEAASGIIRAVRELKYIGAEKIDPHDHSHKHAIFPYLQIVQQFFAQTIGEHSKNYTLHLQPDDEAGVEKLTLAIEITINSERKLAYPIPPLNFFVDFNGERILKYEEQMRDFVSTNKKTTIKEYIKETANLRNKILYASPNGYPEITELSDTFIEKRRSRVIAMLSVFLLIYQHKEHQLFVQQSINSFLENFIKLKSRKT